MRYAETERQPLHYSSAHFTAVDPAGGGVAIYGWFSAFLLKEASQLHNLIHTYKQMCTTFSSHLRSVPQTKEYKACMTYLIELSDTE